jgi:hypothetical protein
MSSAAVELRPVATPGRVGQSTAVEQSRAVAEVQAAVIVAQERPRSVQLAIEAMEEACRQVELAEVAFFRFPRADGVIEGPSVHLARELARCWGNIQYGVRELARDDAHRQSEMQAWAWDVQTNTRDSSDFIVPHQRDTKKGVKDLAELRDIYENNANNGARRLREMIFAMLPVWYRARAEKLCRETIQNGGGVPLAQRVADAVKAFERHRVSPARLAAKFGYKSVDELLAVDVAQLGVIYSSLQQGTVTVDDEFPAEAALITPADLAAPKNPSPAGAEPPVSVPAAAPPAEVAPAGEALKPGKPRLASTGQVGLIRKGFQRLYPGEETPDERTERLRQTSRLARIPYPGISSTTELTSDQAREVKAALDQCKTAADLEALIESGALADDPREDGDAGE